MVYSFCDTSLLIKKIGRLPSFGHVIAEGIHLNSWSKNDQNRFTLVFTQGHRGRFVEGGQWQEVLHSKSLRNLACTTYDATPMAFITRKYL